jgi:hypothetical protein
MPEIAQKMGFDPGACSSIDVNPNSPSLTVIQRIEVRVRGSSIIVALYSVAFRKGSAQEDSR